MTEFNFASFTAQSADFFSMFTTILLVVEVLISILDRKNKASKEYKKLRRIGIAFYIVLLPSIFVSVFLDAVILCEVVLLLLVAMRMFLALCLFGRILKDKKFLNND